MNSVLGIIPARMASQRLPQKALADIAGKSLLQRVYENALNCTEISDLVIATDHREIVQKAIRFGGRVMITSPLHQSGTERCAEVAEALAGHYELILNIQGDEPFIPIHYFFDLIQLMQDNTQIPIATLIAPIVDDHILRESSTVKVVRAINGKALYFSRASIPFARDGKSIASLFQHLGVYIYRPEVLTRMAALPPTPLEQTEKLEQLRWIENGEDIYTLEVPHPTLGIDTPEDLQKAWAIAERNKL